MIHRRNQPGLVLTRHARQLGSAIDVLLSVRRHRGFVDESCGPARALRAVWTARGQREDALPTACPHSRASRPQLHRADNKFFQSEEEEDGKVP